MKINDSINKTGGLPISPQQGRTEKAPEKVSSTPTPPSTNVQISSLSSQLQAMQSTQASSAVFEAKKVEEIKLAISEGRFQVNSEKVADGLLETVKDLLSSRKRG
ncbi:flagellar biosynthesis anti-sigma factor FlgM [Undibacterium luofuense]|uniref:Negative regulator of flagellin synthesis n=1 Tax=Undibacterium luofuense TaxID=2828733 RepID=A0A941DLZ8_9BURK|nr:flagellar biosynthesis anti-sigma factor FlgM [Undibacterium luofuense]MBR7783313.1 flagellar biosynthesis anti-sigma factor FlgM [Undibacterium luofuense]